MKVVFNTWSGAFFHPGGGEVQLLNSKKYIEKAGCKVDFFDLWKPTTNFDIFHQFSVLPGLEHVMKAYREMGKKIALSPITWTEPPVDHPYFSFIQNMFHLADVLMTNSEAESHRLSKSFGIDISKFHKTRNSITDEYLTDSENSSFRDQYGIKGDFVLSVANVEPRKNLERLVDICKELNLQLVSIGHIKEPSYLRSFQGRYQNFTQLGPITDFSILKSAYQTCRVFALPSLCETPGIAALEAASQGARIVITNEGPTEEYFGPHAIYVNPYDQESIRQGLIEGMESKPRDDQKAFIRGQYTWDRTAQDIIAGYKKN